MKMCAEVLAGILEEAGFTHIFGHPGEQILPLYEALRKSGLEHVLMRHEQGAVHAADGYARASGGPGVCVATGGPGALNLVMGVAAASTDSVPLIAMTGDLPRGGGPGRFQEVDLEAVFRALTRMSMTPGSGDEASMMLADSISSLRRGLTGVIHINLPRDVLEEDACPPVGPSEVFRELPDMSRALELLGSTRRPLILAGGGVIWGNAVGEFREFIENARIPVVTTYSARGVIPEDHPLCLGMTGTRGTPAANHAAGNCDVLLVLGARLSERTLAATGNPRVIHVNTDPSVLRGDVVLEMDVGDFLRELPELKGPEGWFKELAAYRRDNPPISELQPPGGGAFVTSSAVRGILDAAPDATIVNDAGSHTTWVTLHRRVLRERSLIFSGGFGPMGYGLPAAIGAKLADPSRDVIMIAGDGGFQMTIQELGTVAELELPITMCILNNQKLDVIRQWQEMNYGTSYSVELKNPDFIRLADAYGIGAERILRLEDVSGAVERALESGEPRLLEFMVEGEDIPLPGVRP